MILENTKVNQPEERDADDLSSTWSTQNEKDSKKRFKGYIKMNKEHQQCKEDSMTLKEKTEKEIVMENRQKDSIGEYMLFTILFRN